jgi:nucleotide-binding universal stress UspA family protein
MKGDEMAQGREPRVVVGVDGSTESLGALDWAVTFAEQFGREITVVVAWQLPMPHTHGISAVDFEAAAERVSTSLVESVRASHPSLEIKGRVVPGAPGRVLVEATEEHDLLVVGTRLTLGSVSSYCVHYAPCTVVVVRGTVAARDE